MATKTKEKKEVESGNKGIEREKDLPWNDKKVKLFKALKTLKSFNEDNACSSKELADKAGIGQKDVRHYGYAARAGGLIEVCRKENVTGYCFFLTAEGKKVDPDKALKQQIADKVKSKVKEKKED